MSAPAAKPRGRPRAFSQEEEAIFRNLFPEITTRRGMQNRMYAVRAIGVLNASAGGDPSGRFEWLVGPSRDHPKMRFTVLTELGRIDNPADIATFADVLCQKKYTSRMAIALIRQRVRKTANPQPTVDAATDYLAGAVDAWFEQYPDANRRVMLDALNEVYSIIQERTEMRQLAS